MNRAMIHSNGLRLVRLVHILASRATGGRGRIGPNGHKKLDDYTRGKVPGRIKKNLGYRSGIGKRERKSRVRHGDKWASALLI